MIKIKKAVIYRWFWALEDSIVSKLSINLSMSREGEREPGFRCHDWLEMEGNQFFDLLWRDLCRYQKNWQIDLPFWNKDQKNSNAIKNKKIGNYRKNY